jgi:hypothetical protein
MGGAHRGNEVVCLRQRLNSKSRVNREVHARFREKLGVKSPGFSRPRHPGSGQYPTPKLPIGVETSELLSEPKEPSTPQETEIDDNPPFAPGDEAASVRAGRTTTSPVYLTIGVTLRNCLSSSVGLAFTQKTGVAVVWGSLGKNAIASPQSVIVRP